MKQNLLAVFLCCYIFSAYSQSNTQNDLKELLKQKPHLRYLPNDSPTGSYLKSESEGQKALETPARAGNIELAGGDGENLGKYIVNDQNGNTYLFGIFRRSMELGGQTIEGLAKNSYYLAVYNSSNELTMFKTLIDSETNATFEVNSATFFDNGLLLVGESFDDLTINNTTYPFSKRNSFILKLNTDGTTAWFKEYENSRSQIGRLKKSPLSTSTDNIFFSPADTEILKLDKTGEYVGSINLFATEGQIGDIAISGTNMIIAGYFHNQIELGDTTLYETNQYEASFITSRDLNTSSTNWAYQNSLADPNDFGDSWGTKLFTDDVGNVYLKGSYRGNMQWENNIYSGTQGDFISKFYSSGAIDSTLLLDGRSYNELLFGNNLYLLNNSIYSVGQNIVVSDDDIIVFDENLDFVEAKQLSVKSNFLTNLNQFSSHNGNILLTGSIDYNSVLLTINTSDYSVISEIESNTTDAGSFLIRGMESYNDYTYIAGNKVGNINIYGTTLTDSSSAVIVQLNSDNLTEGVTSFYNAKFSQYYGNSFQIEAATGKMSVIGEAEANFAIGDQNYDITGNFIAQLNTDGSVDWVKGLQDLTLHAVCYDNDRNVYLSGSMSKDFSSEGTTYSLKGYSDFFILKLSPAGNLEWFKNFGAVSSNTYNSGITSSNNQIFFTGEYWFSEEVIVDVDGIPVTLGTDANGFNLMAGLDTEGNANWAKGHGQSNLTNGGYYYWATGFTGSETGGFYMSGIFGENNLFDDFVLESPYRFNHFIAKYDESGNAIWVKPIRTSKFGHNYGEIRTDENDNVYTQGDILENAEFDTDTTVINQSFRTVYIAKYLSGGDLSWVNTMSGDYLYSVVMDVKGEDLLKTGGHINGLFSTESQTGNAFQGKSYIVDFCKNPLTPDAPTGLSEVFQEDTTSYTVAVPYYNSTEWVLSPTEAGKLVYFADDSVAVEWSADFKGEASLKLRQENICGGSDFSEVILINVNEKAITASSKNIRKQIVYYPNPANSTINLEWNSSITVISIELYDIMGKKLSQTEIPNNANSGSIDINKLSQGTYILKIHSTEGEIMERIVKSNR